MSDEEARIVLFLVFLGTFLGECSLNLIDVDDGRPIVFGTLECHENGSSDG